MKPLLASLALALLGSCASLADLRAYQDAAEADLAAFKAGTITEEEYRARELENREELTANTEDMVDAALAGFENGPVTGNPLADLLLGSAGAAAAAAFGVNRHRNNKRRDHGPGYKPR